MVGVKPNVNQGECEALSLKILTSITRLLKLLKALHNRLKIFLLFKNFKNFLDFLRTHGWRKAQCQQGWVRSTLRSNE